MKKNKMMRLASFLLVAVLLTTSVISGTYAKYVTADDAGDSARVAHWGVEVVVTGEEAFKTEYEGTPGANNGDKVTVKSSTAKKLMAPGTGGTLATFDVTGSPEVDALVEVDAEVGISAWLIDHDGDGITDYYYCPLVVDVAGTKIFGNDFDSAVLFAGEIKKTIQSYTKYYNAHSETDLGLDVDITWNWYFDDTDTLDDDQTDELDTILGNKAANRGDNADYISLDLTVTVTQVD